MPGTGTHGKMQYQTRLLDHRGSQIPPDTSFQGHSLPDRSHRLPSHIHFYSHNGTVLALRPDVSPGIRHESLSAFLLCHCPDPEDTILLNAVHAWQITGSAFCRLLSRLRQNLSLRQIPGLPESSVPADPSS